MKTMMLLDVPKSHHSKRERLLSFMNRHGIVSYHSKGMLKEELPWIVCLMPRARRFGYGVTESSSLHDCIMKVGRLLEEAEVVVYGQTEYQAVKRLCEANEIEFELSMTALERQE